MSDKIMIDIRVSQAKLAELLKYVLKTQVPTNRSEFGRILINMLHGILKQNGLIEPVSAKFYEEYWKGSAPYIPNIRVDFKQGNELEEKKIMEILTSTKQERR